MNRLPDSRVNRFFAALDGSGLYLEPGVRMSGLYLEPGVRISGLFVESGIRKTAAITVPINRLASYHHLIHSKWDSVGDAFLRPCDPHVLFIPKQGECTLDARGVREVPN
jgi:hypothetical protein